MHQTDKYSDEDEFDSLINERNCDEIFQHKFNTINSIKFKAGDTFLVYKNFFHNNKKKRLQKR